MGSARSLSTDVTARACGATKKKVRSATRQPALGHGPSRAPQWCEARDL